METWCYREHIPLTGITESLHGADTVKVLKAVRLLQRRARRFLALREESPAPKSGLRPLPVSSYVMGNYVRYKVLKIRCGVLAGLQVHLFNRLRFYLRIKNISTFEQAGIIRCADNLCNGL